MATRQKTPNIALKPHLDEFLQRKIKSGRYHSASEVVRETLRITEQHEQIRQPALEEIHEKIRLGYEQARQDSRSARCARGLGRHQNDEQRGPKNRAKATMKTNCRHPRTARTDLQERRRKGIDGRRYWNALDSDGCAALASTLFGIGLDW